MMEWLKQRLRRWLGIDAMEQRQTEIIGLANGIARALKEMQNDLEKHDRMDVDVGYRGPCTLILTGQYRGKGYVKFYEMDIDEFKAVVDHYRSMERQSLIRNVDAPNSATMSGGAFWL